jgi:hypothetical protein
MFVCILFYSDYYLLIQVKFPVPCLVLVMGKVETVVTVGVTHQGKQRKFGGGSRGKFDKSVGAAWRFQLLKSVNLSGIYYKVRYVTAVFGQVNLASSMGG